MMKQIRFTVPLFLLILSLPATGQMDSPDSDTLRIDVRRAVEIALDGSPDVARSRYEEQISKLAYRATHLDLYVPRVDLSLQTPSFTQAQNEQLIFDPDSGRTVRRWITTENQRWSGDLNLTQPLPTGGEISLQSNLYRRFYSSDVTSEGNDIEFSSSWRVMFSQELLRGNMARISRQRAMLRFERTLHSGVRARRQLAFNVLQSFYNLLSSQRELAITEEDLNASAETANIARRKFEAGLIPEVEALQLEVEVAQKEAELSSAQASFEASLDRFRVQLGLALTRPLSIEGEPEFQEESVNLEGAVAAALEHREDVRLTELDLEQAEMSLADAKRPWRPSGRVNAFYNLERRDSELESAISTTYDDYNLNRGFTLSLTVPLFSGGRRNTEVQQAVLSKRRAEFEAEQSETEIVLEVRDAVRQLDEARRRYEITLRSLDIAQTSYEITRNRFENGQVTARSWIDAQLALKRNRISALHALIDHNLAVARYRLVVGDDILPGLEGTQPDELKERG
ncbi:TolC family protein [bacterium]|nr:TolC family protein [bacterium]